MLVQVSRSEQRVVDPVDVYALASVGDHTEVRLRGRQPLVDVRPLGEVAPEEERFGIVRIQRESGLSKRNEVCHPPHDHVAIIAEGWDRMTDCRHAGSS